MPGGVGILVPHPLEDPADFEARIPKEVDVKDKLSHVIQAVARIKEVNIVNQIVSTKLALVQCSFHDSRYKYHDGAFVCVHASCQRPTVGDIVSADFIATLEVSPPFV